MKKTINHADSGPTFQWAAWNPIKPSGDREFEKRCGPGKPNVVVYPDGFTIVTMCNFDRSYKSAKSICQCVLKTVVRAAIRRGELVRI